MSPGAVFATARCPGKGDDDERDDESSRIRNVSLRPLACSLAAAAVAASLCSTPALAQGTATRSQSQATSPVTPQSRLLTPGTVAVALVDHQPAVAFPITSIDRQTLVNNSVALTKTAMAFKVPLVLSTIREDSSGPLFEEITAAAPGVPVIARPSRRNAWEDPNFVRAVEATGRRKLVMAGLWTEVCLALTTQSAIEAGYQVYIVTDASGGTTKEAHDMAVQRMIQAGAIPVTWLQVNRELLDASSPQPASLNAAIRDIDKAHSGALGLVWEMNDINALKAANGPAASGPERRQ